MDARSQRRAQNEVRFRALNERLRDRAGALGGNGGLLSLVCECGNEDCAAPIALTPAEYEAVRAESADFAVLGEHVARAVEDVVTELAACTVVRKRGEAAEIAAGSDPRA
jgi:hypothetical protein